MIKMFVCLLLFASSFFFSIMVSATKLENHESGGEETIEIRKPYGLKYHEFFMKTIKEHLEDFSITREDRIKTRQILRKFNDDHQKINFDLSRFLMADFKTLAPRWLTDYDQFYAELKDYLNVNFRILDNWLSYQRKNSLEPETMMEEVKNHFDWASSTNSKTDPFERNYKRVGYSRIPIPIPNLQTLNLFLSMSTANEEQLCNRQSYDVFRKNEEASRRFKNGGLWNVVRHYASANAIICRPIYPVNLRETYEELENQDYLHKVDVYTNQVFNWFLKFTRRNTKQPGEVLVEDNSFYENDYASFYKTLYTSFIDKEIYITKDAYSAIALSVIEKRFVSSSPEEDSNQINSSILKLASGMANEGEKEKLKELVMKNLIKPCAYFVRELGPDIFTPAKFDLKWTKSPNAYYSPKDSTEDKEFFYTWAQFRICESLVLDKGSFLEKLIQVASNRK